MNSSQSSRSWAGTCLVLAGKLSHVAVLAGGFITLASVFLIGFDVFARKFFGFNTGGADELSGYAFAISTSWAMAYTALERVNVRVDFLYQHLPVRLAAVLDWLALVSLAIFLSLLTWFAYDVAATSWLQQSTANTPLGTRLWIPQGLWLIGFAWMCLVLALMLVRASSALATGDLAGLQALCGVKSSQEEASEEAAMGERFIKEGGIA